MDVKCHGHRSHPLGEILAFVVELRLVPRAVAGSQPTNDPGMKSQPDHAKSRFCPFNSSSICNFLQQLPLMMKDRQEGKERKSKEKTSRVKSSQDKRQEKRQDKTTAP